MFLKTLGALLLVAVISVTSSFGLMQWHPNFFQTDISQLYAVNKQIRSEFNSCSGVAIARRLVLTAAHCDQGTVMKIDGYNVRILLKDTPRDLMLLYAREVECPCIGVAKTQPVAGTKVFTAGYPLAKGPVVTEGHLQGSVSNRLTKDWNIKDMQLMSTPAIAGNSGGGVFVKEWGQWKLVSTVSGGELFPFQGMYPVFVMHMVYGPQTQSINSFLKVLGV